MVCNKHNRPDEHGTKHLSLLTLGLLVGSSVVGYSDGERVGVLDGYLVGYLVGDREVGLDFQYFGEACRVLGCDNGLIHS